MLEFNKLERKIAERLGNFAVTPCVGVWIEISFSKFQYLSHSVTPCVGVWIEIPILYLQATAIAGHSLCGSVD